VQRWHEKFELDDVPFIEEASFISTQKQINKPDNKPKKITDRKQASNKQEAATKDVKPVASELTKLNPDTINKIRQREKNKKEQDTPEAKLALHRKVLISKLPTMCEKLRSYLALY
jgi:hypothetical protein